MSFARWVSLAVVLVVCGTATRSHADETGKAYLRWDFGPPQPTQSPVYKVCYARSLSWVDAADRVIWTHALPARMQAVDAGVCDCQRPDGKGSCAAEIAMYLANPRQGSPPFVIGSVAIDHALAVADTSGILVLDEASGKPLLDWAPTAAADSGFFADSAHYVVEGMNGCAGEARRTRLFVRCDDKLVWFAASTAAVIDPVTWTVVATGSVPKGPFTQGDPVHVATRVPLGRWALALTGVIYMR